MKYFKWFFTDVESVGEAWPPLLGSAPEEFIEVAAGGFVFSEDGPEKAIADRLVADQSGVSFHQSGIGTDE